MSDTSHRPRTVAVPAGRLHRMARLGGLATQVAGAVALGGAKALAGGARPQLRDLVLTPGNIERLTQELAQMRGAAMKVGQLISLEAGDLLPAELTAILSRLRSDAHQMPPQQLKQVLNAAWGQGWQRQYVRFDVRPIAAASIGQVHRARLKDGRDLAVKVQYPGVAQSIDSDVANVGALLRAARVLPKGFDLAPYLEAARLQLHEETDYLREGAQLQWFARYLEGQERFLLPAFHADWSTGQVLAMSHVAGHPVEDLQAAPQATRDGVMRDLFALFFDELFTFNDMQSDPNFANFLYQPDEDRIVLLDFGATRAIASDVVQGYRDLLAAGLAGRWPEMKQAAAAMGLLAGDMRPDHHARLIAMMQLVFTALRAPDPFDFADTRLSQQLQAEGLALMEEGMTPPPVAMDVLYVQRKLGGLALLATRLCARVDLQALLAPHLRPAGNTSPNHTHRGR